MDVSLWMCHINISRFGEIHNRTHITDIRKCWKTTTATSTDLTLLWLDASIWAMIWFGVGWAFGFEWLDGVVFYSVAIPPPLYEIPTPYILYTYCINAIMSSTNSQSEFNSITLRKEFENFETHPLSLSQSFPTSGDISKLNKYQHLSWSFIFCMYSSCDWIAWPKCDHTNERWNPIWETERF